MGARPACAAATKARAARVRSGSTAKLREGQDAATACRRAVSSARWSGPAPRDGTARAAAKANDSKRTLRDYSNPAGAPLLRPPAGRWQGCARFPGPGRFEDAPRQALGIDNVTGGFDEARFRRNPGGPRARVALLRSVQAAAAGCQPRRGDPGVQEGRLGARGREGGREAASAARRVTVGR